MNWADSSEALRQSDEVSAIKDTLGIWGASLQKGNGYRYRCIWLQGDDAVLLETVLLELVEIKRGSGIMPHIPCR